MFDVLNILPRDILNIIEKFIPKTTLIFLNKTYFNKYFSLFVDRYIMSENNKLSNIIFKRNIETYIKKLLKKDKYFVLNKICEIYFYKFISISKYKYKQFIFPTYYHYLIHISKEYKSNKCTNIFLNHFSLNGINKNKYKRLKIINNIWMN